MSQVWEAVVELRVRKTLVLAGPTTEEAARSIFKASLAPSGMGTWILQKKTPGTGNFPMAEPVEEIIDNDPQIISVSQVDGN